MRQHLACWPMVAQVSMNSLTLAGVTVADEMLTCEDWKGSVLERTWVAVQVRDVEDVSCAANGVAGAAKANLALIKGGRSSEGRSGESEDDGGVLHDD
jgi:hypothetical protein